MKMGYRVEVTGKIVIPAEKQAEAVAALKANAASREDTIPDSNSLDEVFAQLLDPEDHDIELEGDELSVYWFGKSFDFQDEVVAALAPFATVGWLHCEGDDDERWISRFIDGVIHIYPGKVVYPDSPYEEDH